MRQQKRSIGSWQFSRKWQESIKGFAKPQMRWQRGKSWQTAIIRKWQILGEKGKFRQRWRVCQKVIEASAKYSNKITKVASWQMTILRKLQIWQEFIVLPNHYIHPGYHEMRTHRRRSVHVSFAVGLVVCIFLRYFYAVGSCLSR